MATRPLPEGQWITKRRADGPTALQEEPSRGGGEWVMPSQTLYRGSLLCRFTGHNSGVDGPYAHEAQLFKEIIRKEFRRMKPLFQITRRMSINGQGTHSIRNACIFAYGTMDPLGPDKLR